MNKNGFAHIGLLIFLLAVATISVAYFTQIDRIPSRGNDSIDREFGTPSLKIVWSGGLCLAGSEEKGECSSELVLQNDGSYVFDGRSGNISMDEARKLSSLMNAADFGAIRAKGFSGVCPRAYDGVAPTYTFYLEAREEVIDSCNVEIDASSPLFSEIDKITESFFRRP